MQALVNRVQAANAAASTAAANTVQAKTGPKKKENVSAHFLRSVMIPNQTTATS